MATLTIRMADSEKLRLEEYAKFQGKSVSGLVREMIALRIEDEEDAQAIREYEAEEKKGSRRRYTLDEIAKRHGLDL